MATERTKVTEDAFEAGLFELSGATEHAKILIYGDPGSGKTRFSGTAPGNVLILAGEPGYISAAQNGGRGKVRLIPDSSTALAGVSWLESGGADKFDWCIVDGANTMQTKFMLGYAAEAFDNSNGTKRAHRNLPDKPDYLNAQNFMKGWIARLIDLPMNLIVTTHAMRTESDDGDLIVKPAFQGKAGEVSDYIAGQFHAVGFIRAHTIKRDDGSKRVRRILWEKTEDPKKDTTYVAKDQYDSFGRYTDDATIPDLLALISGSGTRDQVESASPAKKAATKRAKGRDK